MFDFELVADDGHVDGSEFNGWRMRQMMGDKSYEHMVDSMTGFDEEFATDDKDKVGFNASGNSWIAALPLYGFTLW